MSNVWTLALAVMLLNLPLGFWRAGTRKFSATWFLAVHSAVPLVIGLRFWTGLGWEPTTLLLVASAFFAGQLVGGRLRGRWGARTASG